MHRTPLSQISIFSGICAFLLASAAFGQIKSAGEVDVTRCWSYPTRDAVGSAHAADGSRLFIGLGGARVEALSLDGKKMWASELGGEITSNILPLDSALILVTSTAAIAGGKPGESSLRALSKETGITNWTLKLAEADRHFLGSSAGTVIVVSRIGVIQSIDAKNGSVKWKREIADGFVAEPVFSGERLSVAASGKQIFTISLASGEIESMRKFPFPITALAITARGELVTGDERGNVSSLTGTDKTNWKFKSGGEISAIAAVGDHLLATSYDNFIYFLVSRNGGRSWKKRLPGRVPHIAVYADLYALISSFEEHGAVLTDLSNGKVAGQIAFRDDEWLVSSPLVSSGMIFVLTNQAAYAYSLNGCPADKQGGNGQESPSPPL